MKVVDQLLHIIYKEPETCSCDGYRFKVNNAKFWIANGRTSFKFTDCEYPKECLNYWDRRKIWKAYKWWARNASQENFKYV